MSAPPETPLEAAWRGHEQSGPPLPAVEARPQATSGSDPAKSGEPLWLLHQGLERAAARFPEREAVHVGEDSAWSYARLYAAGLARAHALHAAGMPAGARVGVWMPKSPAAIAALWATLRAGGVYVPLDPLAPTARIEALAADCGVWGVFADAERAAAAAAWGARPAWIGEEFPEAPPPGLELPQPERTGQDLAYILYTSGSTGVPKGVMLSHQHALNFVQWATAATALTPADRVASHAPFHFDLSIFDLWATLGAGAEVCLLDSVTARFPNAVAAWIAERRISVWYSVPSALVAMVPSLEAAWGGHAQIEARPPGDRRERPKQNLAAPRDRIAAAPPGLRAVIFAGEVFPAAALRAWRQALPEATFHNWYGPTETNVCTHYQLPPGTPPDPLPIGRACPNFELALWDDERRPVGPGETGYLWARGPGLLTGYWGDEARTRAVTCERPSPAGGPPERWYNTGDRARRGAGGELYFQGRRDALIKCRGYRISLLEIEQAFEACPGVAQAAVVPVPDAERATSLQAFVRPADTPGPPLDPARLRAWLSQRLPAYMIPEAIAIRGELPTTSTGKIDRQRLTRATAV